MNDEQWYKFTVRFGDIVLVLVQIFGLLAMICVLIMAIRMMIFGIGNWI